MKDSNKKFEGFAHNLIAESLKKWAGHSKFVAAKLEQRLMAPIDELDEKIANVLFQGKGSNATLYEADAIEFNWTTVIL